MLVLVSNFKPLEIIFIDKQTWTCFIYNGWPAMCTDQVQMTSQNMILIAFVVI